MKCKDVEFGTYECSYNIKVPYLCKFSWEDESEYREKYVNIDKCLMRDILEIWEAGIKTTGCCCGHERSKPFISVVEGYESKMKAIGYEQYESFDEAEKSHSHLYFKPKSIMKYNIFN